MDRVKLLDEIKQNTEKIEGILALGQTEQRKLNDAEVAEMAGYQVRNVEINNLMNTEKNKEKMEEKFSFIRALNQVVNGQQLDGIDKETINKGQANLRMAGLSSGGQLVIPTANLRSAITLTGNAIQSNKVATPSVIADALVFSKVGASYGVYNSEFTLPSIGQGSATWEDETAAASDGAGTISTVKLSPKRLTTYVDISKKFIAMDNVAAEQLIINDIVNAVSRKLEATILGKAAGSTTQPAGLFNVAPTIKGATSYANVVAVEEALQVANGVDGSPLAWIVNPKVKTKFRTTAKVTNGSVIMENDNTALSYPLYASNLVASGLQTGVDEYGAVLADWSKLVIAQFGDAIDLTIDPYTLAGKGEVRVTVNFYVDAAFRNPAYYATASFK